MGAAHTLHEKLYALGLASCDGDAARPSELPVVGMTVTVQLVVLDAQSLASLQGRRHGRRQARIFGTRRRTDGVDRTARGVAAIASVLALCANEGAFNRNSDRANGRHKVQRR